MENLNFVEVEKNSGVLVEFLNPKDFVIGKVIGTHEGTTVHGDALFLDLADLDTGESKTVCLASSLQGYKWHEMVDKVVKIEYIGNQKNEKTRRTFKAFKVYVNQ